MPTDPIAAWIATQSDEQVHALVLTCHVLEDSPESLVEALRATVGAQPLTLVFRSLVESVHASRKKMRGGLRVLGVPALPRHRALVPLQA